MSNKKQQQQQAQLFQPVTLQDAYERDIAKKRHNCTDVLCLIIFILFGIVQLLLTLVVFIKGGDPRTFLLPHDSSGNVCTGSTPNLFYFNMAACLNVNALISSCPTPTICVNTCPSNNLFYMIDSQRSTLFSNYCDSTKLLNYFNSQLPISIDSTTYSTLVTKQICPAYVLASSSFYSRCIPTVITSVLNGITTALTVSDSSSNSTMNITDSQNNTITDQTISSAAQYIIKLLNLNTIANYIIDDLTKAAVLIGVLLGIASVASFIYILIMRWIITPIVYLTLLILIGGLSFVIYYCVTKYLALKDSTPSGGFQFSTDINYYFGISYTWLVIACIAALILIIILLLLIVMFKRLRLAIQLICEASRAVNDTFITVLFPVIPLLLELGFLVYFAATAVFLACNSSAIYKIANTNTTSSNSTSNGTTESSVTTCDPTISLTNTSGLMCLFYAYGNYANQYLNVILSFLSNYQWLPQVYNLFMFFWTEFFLIGLNQMILAGCFGIWYWSQARSSCILLTSIKDTLVYHLGSIAFGSLILAVVQIIRVIIQYIQTRVKNTSGDNSITRGLVKFISCCCACCFYCLDKVIKFINRNAYIMVAIYGRNFCRRYKSN
jgi:solute carrier family 44 (choline transporter-like protein), member 2/4/5